MAPKLSDVTKLSGTELIHADDALGPEVAPSISVTTSEYDAVAHGQYYLILIAAFRAPHPEHEDATLGDPDPMSPTRHVYSRYTQVRALFSWPVQLLIVQCDRL
jgi:hypothetical protein